MTTTPDTPNCWLCSNVADHTTIQCCSSHGRILCHRCYRRTHFVEVCNCSLCNAPVAAGGASA